MLGSADINSDGVVAAKTTLPTLLLGPCSIRNVMKRLVFNILSFCGFL